ncbi:MAG: DUF2007 domain-containing protein [Flavobacteriia bacterium]|jgi:DNA-directed RNA polymerase subunit RPC12/RpoP
MELITFKSFESSIDAHFLRIRLENGGLQAFIFDENTVIMNPLNSYAVGGIKVKIYKKDLESALEIEREFQKNTIKQTDKELICECGSRTFYENFKDFKSVKGILSAIFSLLFAVYPLAYKEVYKCKNCGKEYKI